jgi:hypothetical protein
VFTGLRRRARLVTNQFFPLPVGQQWVYFGREEGDPIGLRITVLKETETFKFGRAHHFPARARAHTRGSTVTHRLESAVSAKACRRRGRSRSG